MIHGLASAKRRQLKQMQDAERIRIVYQAAGGKTLKVTY
jgi:hypothetical protein